MVRAVRLALLQTTSNCGLGRNGLEPVLQISEEAKGALAASGD
jgi:hypothetical protein